MTTTRPEVTFREPYNSSFNHSLAVEGDNLVYNALSCGGCVTAAPRETWNALAIGVVSLILGAVVVVFVVRKVLFFKS